MASDQGGESLGKGTARVLSAVLIGQAASILITGITIILIARLLEPTNYGVYVFAFGFASLIDAVGGFGIGVYLSRHLAIHSFKGNHEKMMRVLSSGYLVLIVSSILLTLLALSLSGYLANTLYASLNIPVIDLVIASLMIFFVMVQAVSTQALIGLQRGFYSSICGVVGNIIQLALGVGLILYFVGYPQMQVEGALVGMLIGYAVSAAMGTFLIFYSLRAYGKTRLSWPNMRELKETARFSFPIGANTMLNDGMQNVSILFLGFYVSKAILGNYGAALKGLAAIILLHNSINSVLIPVFSRAKLMKRKADLHKTYNKVLGYSLVIILPMLVYIIVFSQPAVYLFLSKSYSLAPGYLSLIVFGAIINTISLFVSSLIVSRGNTIKVLKYSTVVALVQLALLVILTPTYLVYGSIVAIFIIGNIVSIVLFMRGARKLFGVKFDHRKILAIFGSNMILGAVLAVLLFGMYYITSYSTSNLVMGVELVVGLAAAALIYPIIFVMTKAINSEDIESIRSSTERLPLLKTPMAWMVRYSRLFLGAER